MKMKYSFFAILFVLGLTNATANINQKYHINDVIVESLFSAVATIDVADLSSDYLADISLNGGMSVQVDDPQKVTAGILGIVVGCTGLHRWYSGSPLKVWIIYPVASLFGIGGIMGLIDGVMILIGDDSEYSSKWVNSEKIIVWL